jgi:hypothetical protein
MERVLWDLTWLIIFFLWRYSPNLGLGLPPWNSPFHFGSVDLRLPVGLLGRVVSSSQGPYVYPNTGKRTHSHTHTHTLNIHAPMGFEPTIPASERAKTVHTLDCSATVTGMTHYTYLEYTTLTQFSFIYLFCSLFNDRSRGSVVGIATGYGLDDWGGRISSPGRVRIFYSPNRPNRL